MNKLLGFVWYHGNNDYSIWEGDLSKEDEDAIKKILKKYETEGSSYGFEGENGFLVDPLRKKKTKSYKDDPKVKVFDEEITEVELTEEDDVWYGILEYDDGRYAVDYNCYRNYNTGEKRGLFYMCFPNRNGYLETDLSTGSSLYVINFDDPDWKEILIQTAYEFMLKSIAERESENY